MGKDPAVLFYPADFIVGCIGLSDAQIGQYIQLLCIQHQKGHLGEAIILKICGTLDEEILSKFSIDTEGNYFNERMEQEVQKRKKHSAQQSLNAKKRWDKKPVDVCGGNATAMPLENENENEDVNEVKVKKGICLLKNSGVTAAQVSQAFLKTDDLKSADAKFYFDSAFDWSENGNMRKDWIATIRSFARRDLRDGKMKVSVFKQVGGSNLSSDKILPSKVSATAITREEYLRLKKLKQDGIENGNVSPKN